MIKYKKFDILKVAAQCEIELDSRTLRRREVMAWCPFCQTPSSNYHMSINPEKECFFCHKCSAFGNTVSLYARMQGISNKEAAEQLAGGNYAPANPVHVQARHLQATVHVRHRNAVYHDMLKTLPLSEKHRMNLLERGLSDERIRRNMYRTMPKDLLQRRRVAQYLARHHDLRGVPGFYYSQYGYWELWGKSGVLIPVRDANDNIQGMQIRLDDVSKNKYRWLSSNPDYGYPYGAASSAWVHVTGNSGNAKEVYITEGALKGDVASYLSGDRLFICTAGVSSIQHLADTIKGLKVTRANSCYDMDQIALLQALVERRNNPHDAEAQKPCPIEKMEAVVHSTGIPCIRRTWSPEFNGVDELYLDWSKNRQQRAA